MSAPQPQSAAKSTLRNRWWLALLIVIAVAAAVVVVVVVVVQQSNTNSTPSRLDQQNEALARCDEEPFNSQRGVRVGECADNEKYQDSLTSDEKQFVDSMLRGALRGSGLQAVDILIEVQVHCDETRDLGADSTRYINDQRRSTAESLGIRIDAAIQLLAAASQFGCPDLLTAGDRFILGGSPATDPTTGVPVPTTTSATATAAGGLSTADQAFLTAANADDLTSTTQENYVVEAKAVCQYRIHGKSNPDMTDYLRNALDLDTARAEQVRVAAITAYCPNYLY